MVNRCQGHIFPHLFSYMFIWGSNWILVFILKVIELENTSLNELSIPVDKICAANCELTILVSVPRQEDNSIDIPDDLNVHPLFDPALPHTKAFYEDIIVLQVRILFLNFFSQISHTMWSKSGCSF